VTTGPFALDKSGPVRKFLDTDLQKRVEEALAKSDAKNGAVVVAVNEEGLGVEAYIGRPGGHWSICGKVEKPWKGSLEANAYVAFSW